MDRDTMKKVYWEMATLRNQIDRQVPGCVTTSPREAGLQALDLLKKMLGEAEVDDNERECRNLLAKPL